MKDSKKTYKSESLNKDLNYNHLIKHFSNGFLRLVILWIINKEKIHGYCIMKCLDRFFSEDIEKGFFSKFTSSKIYPILHYMEDKDLIIGEWDVKNNKNLKYYSITPKGESLLIHIKNRNKKLFSKRYILNF